MGRPGEPRVSRRARGVRMPAYARTLIVGSLSIALAFVSVSNAGSAPVADASFSNGTAQAVAQVVRVAPGVGSLQLATSVGSTVSQIANNLAQAQAQAIDLGLIGTALTAEKCDGSPGALRPEQLPQPTKVDNRKGDATATSDEIPLEGSTLGGGREEAVADQEPAAHAVVSSVASVLGPVATISAGRSESMTRIVDGKAREAESTVSVNIDIAGVVHLENARWRAFHRTGADPTTEGSFSVTNGSALGLPLPLEQLAPLQDAVNAALAPSGITVEFPRIDHLTKPNDVIRVTPLRIILKDSPLGKAALGPGLNLSRTQREQLYSQIMGIDCQLAGAVLVGDITVDIASGTGFLIMEIGGVEATSAELNLGNPFGSEPPFGSLPGELPAPPNVPYVAPATGAVTPSRSVVSPVLAADNGPLEKVCQTLHPSKSPGCSRGTGLPLGLAGLALTSAIAFFDWRRQRRILAEERAVA